MEPIDLKDERIREKIAELIKLCGGDLNTLESELTEQMIMTSLKLMVENHDLGQIKLISRALKEMRYAYRVFNQYPGQRRVSIFGSARTPEIHPDYLAAKHFSEMAASQGWICMTGAAEGIMKAGLEGGSEQKGFGLSIRLPFETRANEIIMGDPKHISFHYFFTRKLMFMSHSDAVAAFPGGVGTMDELFEVLTLMQTGKAKIVPILLIDGGGTYWENWQSYFDNALLANGWVKPHDCYFFHIAESVEEAIKHMNHFYSRYHSSRYVKERLVMRLNNPLSQSSLEDLNRRFSSLVASGTMELSAALPEENDYLDLPRLVFTHTRNDFGLLRSLIDAINDAEGA